MCSSGTENDRVHCPQTNLNPVEGQGARRVVRLQ
jgi:hypothetical protein